MAPNCGIKVGFVFDFENNVVQWIKEMHIKDIIKFLLVNYERYHRQYNLGLLALYRIIEWSHAISTEQKTRSELIKSVQSFKMIHSHLESSIYSAEPIP